MQFRPLDDRVVVRRIEAFEKTAGGAFPSTADGPRGIRSPSMELEILEACIESGAKLIARQREIIRHLRARNCPTVTSENFLRVLEDRQAERLQKWRTLAPSSAKWRDHDHDQRKHEAA